MYIIVMYSSGISNLTIFQFTCVATRGITLRTVKMILTVLIQCEISSTWTTAEAHVTTTKNQYRHAYTIT